MRKMRKSMPGAEEAGMLKCEKRKKSMPRAEEAGMLKCKK